MNKTTTYVVSVGGKKNIKITQLLYLIPQFIEQILMFYVEEAL